MSIKLVVRLIILSAAGYLFSHADPVNEEAPIVLPKIVVTDSKLLPIPESWQYAKTTHFEILSNASSYKTKYIIKDLLEFTQAVSYIWPAIQPKNTQPPLLILCGAGNSYNQFFPTDSGPSTSGGASLSLRNKENAAIIIDVERPSLNIQSEDGPGEIEVDYAHQLHREYIHFLLSRIEPRPQPWLEEGLAQMLAALKYSDTLIEFGKLPDPNEVSVMQGIAMRDAQLQTIAGSDTSTSDSNSLPSIDPGPNEDKAFNAALNRRGLLPMEKIFSVERKSEEALNTIGDTWSKQCWMFVHLCLYGEHQKYQKAFFKFVARSEHEPITEQLFKECFNMSYKDMLMVFRGYIQWTSYKSIEMHPKDGKIPPVTTANFREASDAEVGRIKGEALRMSGHTDAAHLALIAPYVRGSLDPNLLASIGLDELESGDTARASKFLEKATQTKTSRARAYLELGKLRLQEEESKPLAPNGKLDNAQLTRILDPLFQGRSYLPVFPETYSLIALAWSNASAVPTEANLRVVAQGVSLFPHNAELLYNTIVLFWHYHPHDEVLKLCDYAIATSSSQTDKQSFESLKSKLISKL